MADALGVAQLHRLADVEAQPLGRRQARRQLPGVQAEVNFGINRVQVVQHIHLQRVVAHGDESVLGLDKIAAYKAARLARVHAGLDGFKAQQRLGKDLFRRVAAQNLVNVPDLDRAGGGGLRGSAVLNLAAFGFGGAHVLAICRHFVAQAPVQQILAKLGQVRIPADLARNPGRVPKCRRLHQFQVLLVLRRCPAGHLVHPFAGMPLVQPAKPGKGGKKLVVPAEARGGHKAAHGKGVDQPVVEVLVGRTDVS